LNFSKSFRFRGKVKNNTKGDFDNARDSSLAAWCAYSDHHPADFALALTGGQCDVTW
jgi:hypothetical protein